MSDKDINKTIKEIKGKIKVLESTESEIQLERNEDYVKFKMFQKYFQVEQQRRDEKENAGY